MTTKKEAPAKTEAAKHIGKYAIQIVAIRDRLALGLCRFVPSESAALLLALALAGCIGVLVEVFK